jgi:hypothetical protein
MPTVDLTMKSGRIGKPSLESVSGEIAVQSQVTEKVQVGAALGLGESGKERVRNVFVTVTETVWGRAVKVGASTDVTGQNVKGTVELGAGSAGGPTYKAKLSSAHPNVLETVSMTTKGKGWKLTPTIHTKGFEVDLDAETELGPATAAVWSVKHSGKGTVDVFHDINSATKLQVGASSNLADLDVSVARKLGALDTLKPSVDLKRRTVALDWVHKLGSTLLTTSIDQGSKCVAVGLSGEESGDWSAKVSAPWANLADADVSLGRKIDLGRIF